MFKTMLNKLVTGEIKVKNLDIADVKYQWIVYGRKKRHVTILGGPYKTVRVNNFNKLYIMVSGST